MLSSKLKLISYHGLRDLTQPEIGLLQCINNERKRLKKTRTRKYFTTTIISSMCEKSYSTGTN